VSNCSSDKDWADCGGYSRYISSVEIILGIILLSNVALPIRALPIADESAGGIQMTPVSLASVIAGRGRSRSSFRTFVGNTALNVVSE